jgi:GAF domain-containing protein
MRLLSLLGSGKKSDALMTEIVLLIEQSTNIESIGLRLADGIDYPYYFTKGFDQNFVEKETHLCARDEFDEIIRDSDGSPVLECMCGNIICGRTDPALPFFTQGGSFWSNCTTDLLATTTEKDRKARTRNRCNGEGYESVALIPVKAEGKCYGLLQLNDRRKGMFTHEGITFLEGVSINIGILFAMRRSMEELANRAADVARAAIVRSELLSRLANELKGRAVTGETRPNEDAVLKKIENLVDEFQTLKGIIPICCSCKKVRVDMEYWTQVEAYVKERSNAEFTHTFCPQCFEKWEKEELD